ncbi:hypothetical protein [Streptomyces sp. H27-S2]|uniref:hypothetical protein n=1 Tax=Streptomyces antarcticus TaxID=2996458 RepID=UPI00226DAAC1|nr:hypothetical protein [Streptomyces sp. H27-S2]MCY0951889.1 hypothetical protein [Streptomyces sp. H27-S2]
MRETDPPVRLFLRAHGIPAMAVAFLVVLALNAFFGAALLAIPSAEGVRQVPFRREVPVIHASLVAGGLHSLMHTFEESPSSTLRRMQLRYLATATAFALLLVGVCEVVLRDAGAGLQASRSLLAWLALAVVSGRVLGWRLAWVLPVSTIFPLVYYGHGGAGHVYWWDWTSRPAADPWSWALTLVLVIAAPAVLRVTPWRIHSARRAVSRAFTRIGRARTGG